VSTSLLETAPAQHRQARSGSGDQARRPVGRKLPASGEARYGGAGGHLRRPRRPARGHHGLPPPHVLPRRHGAGAGAGGGGARCGG
jgi:hypothetical protein